MSKKITRRARRRELQRRGSRGRAIGVAALAIILLGNTIPACPPMSSPSVSVSVPVEVQADQGPSLQTPCCGESTPANVPAAVTVPDPVAVPPATVPDLEPQAVESSPAPVEVEPMSAKQSTDELLERVGLALREERAAFASDEEDEVLVERPRRFVYTAGKARRKEYPPLTKSLPYRGGEIIADWLTRLMFCRIMSISEIELARLDVTVEAFVQRVPYPPPFLHFTREFFALRGMKNVLHKDGRPTVWLQDAWADFRRLDRRRGILDEVIARRKNHLTSRQRPRRG